MKIVSALVLSSALLVGLAGCSLTASATVPAANIANTAAHALQKTVGLATTPKMDCGKAGITLAVGKKVDCTVTDPTNGKDYDAVVTITKISGSKYSIDVQVAKTPNN
jgi:hypothetical protein